MIRAVISLVCFVVATLVLATAGALSGLVDRSGDTVLKLARLWSRFVLAVAGVKLEVVQHAPLDPRRPYIVMANHASTIDIWAVFLAVPVPLRFIAKKQLGAIPLFGWAMRAGRFIFIDRQNAASARRSIAEAARRIRSGQSVVIFPEGTRTRDGRLNAFKKGGFHMALDSGADIVPVAVHGSRALMPRGSALVRAGTVRVEIGAPVSTAGMAPGDRDALTARVRELIAQMLGEPAVPEPAAVPADSP